MTDTVHEDNFTYDVFVSYRHKWPESKWVRTRLTPALDKAGLKVWLDKRDSLAAEDIYLQTEQIIKASRHAICIVSPSYNKEQKTRDGMVAFELRLLVTSFRDRKGCALVPFRLRGKKIPVPLRDFIGIDWRSSANRNQEWKRLLRSLGAKHPESPPPGSIELFAHRVLVNMAYGTCIAALTVFLGFLANWSKRIPIQPSPHLAIQKVAGQDATAEMLLPPSGSVAGIVEGDLPAGTQVVLYTQATENDADVWRFAGSSFLNGQDWIVPNVEFRQPLTERTTRTTLEAVVITGEPQEILNTNELSELKDDTTSKLSSVVVEVPRPIVEMTKAELDSTGRFIAEGKAENILENREELCFKFHVTSPPQSQPQFPHPLSSSGWKASTQLEGSFKVGDYYNLQVFLGSSGTACDATSIPFTRLSGLSVKPPRSVGASH